MNSMSIVLRAALGLLLGLSVAVGALGCKDKDKLSREKVGPVLERVLPLCERDTKQVRQGLPKGAAVLGKLLDEDPGADPAGLRRMIEKARAGATDLEVAKSTFFVFVSPDGVVLRGEQDPDLAAGQSLVKEVPEATKIFQNDGVTELYGYMHGLRGVEKGGDLQWIVGHQVKSAAGKVLGAFVTGWSLRRYAELLENDARRYLADQAADPTKASPVVYVLIVRGDKAYGAPVTPDVDADAIGKLALPGKVAGGGTFTTTLDVDGRRFAVAAKAASVLGEAMVVAVMLSEV
jgi:hypothetical protein